MIFGPESEQVSEVVSEAMSVAAEIHHPIGPGECTIVRAVGAIDVFRCHGASFVEDDALESIVRNQLGSRSGSRLKSLHLFGERVLGCASMSDGVVWLPTLLRVK